MSDGPCVHMLSRFSISQISGQSPGLKNRMTNTVGKWILPFKNGTSITRDALYTSNLFGYYDDITEAFPHGCLIIHILSLYVQELSQITCALYNQPSDEDTISPAGLQQTSILYKFGQDISQTKSSLDKIF